MLLSILEYLLAMSPRNSYLDVNSLLLLIELECTSTKKYFCTPDTGPDSKYDSLVKYFYEMRNSTFSELDAECIITILKCVRSVFDCDIVFIDTLDSKSYVLCRNNGSTLDLCNCMFLLKLSDGLFQACTLCPDIVCVLRRSNIDCSIISSGMAVNSDSSMPETEPTIGSSSTCHTTNIGECQMTESLYPEIRNFKYKFSSNFVFLHNNINSYRNKHTLASDILCNNLADLVFYSETKLDGTFMKHVFELDGFDLYRQDYTISSGGLLCHMRSDIPHCRMTNLEFNTEGFESLVIKVIIGSFDTLFVAFYRHPFLSDELFKQYFCKIADNAFGCFTDVVFIGDGNCSPSRCSIISDLCELYGLTNIVEGPTCFKSQTNPTPIDVILVNNPRKYVGTLNSNFELSDFHNMIGAATRRFAPNSKPFPINYRSYRKFDESLFLYDLQCAPFHVADIFDDIEDRAWFTSNLLSFTLDSHAPMKKKWVKKKSAPFMNSALRKAIFSRNMARNNFMRFGKSHWDIFRRKRNSLTACRKKSIKNYFIKYGDVHTKRFWPTVSPFLSDKRKGGNNSISLNENGQIINEPQKVAEIFNQHYSTIASTIGFNDQITSVEDAIEKHKNHPSIVKIREKHPDLMQAFNFKTVSCDSVELYLKKFDPKKATGYDGIPGRIIKLAHLELSGPLTKLINFSIENKTFPDLMKFAEINPVYKKDDRLVKNNFRPVSVLTGFSKIFEYVMNDQLVEYFMHIFNSMLSAYRKGYSCQSVLLKLIEDSKSKIDIGMLVGLLLQDLSKAFDCLPHGLIIAKLHAYGLSMSSCEFVASYLKNRKQRVNISSFKSDWIEILKGVPQGSVLGPLLFNVFVNDLFYFIERTDLYNFADDNSLSCASYSLDQLMCNLEHDSKICINWYKMNGMEASPSKFHFIVMSPKPLNSVRLNVYDNVFIESETVVKALGVYIDCNLNFHTHAKQLCLKASRQLNAFSRISRYLSVQAKKLIFRSFIMSNFDYCSLVWHFCGKKNNSKMERIQKRALSIVFDDFDADYDELLNRMETNSILQTRIKRIAIEVYKSINGLNPSYLRSIFEIRNIPYVLRDSSRLDQPLKQTTNYGLRSINYLGSKIWNTLPMHIKNSPDIISLKLALRGWSGVDIESSETSFV